jgi:hypothetical protein
MSIVLNDPSRFTLFGSKEEDKIREIFYQHWEKMKNQMKMIIDVINMWRSQSIEAINSYAAEQIRILQTDYSQQRGIFDQKLEENVETANAYHKTKQIDPFQELCIACRSLEFQLAQLEYVQNQNERPKVITVEELIRRKEQDKANTDVFEFENTK